MTWTFRFVAVIAALGATPFVASSSAGAGEYCRRDVTGHMLGCSFSSLAQCESTRSGIGGDCLRDPFLPDARNSYAYTQVDQGVARDQSVELDTRRNRRKSR